jgi:adenylate cyclase
VGEAGLGKSRLCEEFAQLAGGRGLRVRRASGVSHGREVPLLPILSFQREYFGISESDDAASARRKVTDRVLELDPELEEVLPVLFDFLEVPDPDRPLGSLAPEARMRRVFDAVRKITARRSERETLILIFEDLHWFDPQSEVFLERLIESYPGSRTLVVTNFRPEFSARWMRHSYYRQLPLAPLREQAVGELLGGLLGVDLSLVPLVSFILERTSGNPFFVEEVVRDLIEDGTLAGGPGSYRLTRPLHEIRVPASVQAVLAARIDRLSIDQKAVLETASVIGRTFDAGLLRQVAGSPREALGEVLAALCAAELLQETTSASAEGYRFWHPLTQEVAYGSLLRDRRAVLHGAVARAIIETDPDRLDQQAALLAAHFEQAGERLESGRWNDRAADFALRSDLDEATRRWRSALDDLRALPEDDEAMRLRIRSLSRLIRWGARTGMDEEERTRLYTEATQLAERLGDAAGRAMVAVAYGTTKLWGGALREAYESYHRAFDAALESGDPTLRAAMAAGLAFTATWSGPVSEALDLADETERLCAGDAAFGASIFGYGLLGPAGFMRARALALLGRGDEARAALDEAMAICAGRSEVEWATWMRSESPRYARTDAELEAALDAARASALSAEAAGNTAALSVALGGMGHAELGLGRYREATEHLEQALDTARRHRTALFDESALLADLARARLELGDTDDAWRLAAEAVEVARRQGARPFECAALIARGRVERARGDVDAAQADLTAANDLIDRCGAVSYQPQIVEELGRLRDDATELQRAVELYSRIGATGAARRLEAELSMRADR